MRKWLFALGACLAVGCTRPATPPPAPPPTTPVPQAATLPRVGHFTGTLPCADCQGVETDLVLAGDWEGRTVFHLKETYVGAPGGPRTVDSEGTWTTQRGSAFDPNARIYQLTLSNGTTRSFAVVDERTIRLLDADLRPLPSSVPSSLTRGD